MRIIDLDFYADKGSAIFLGYAGEHLSTVLNFHVPAELGNNDCIYVINFLKDGESSSNIVSHFAYKTKFNTNIVEYYIPSSIMGNNTSSGVFQLVAYGMTTTIGNKVKYSILGKSTEFHYVIDNAITTDTSDLTIELSESESLALQDLIEATSRLGNIETQFNELDGLTDALSTFIEKGDVAYTLDNTTTIVTYDAANPKKIYTNAHVNNKDAFVFTTANNYYQIALCYDGTEYKRELTSGGSTTYKPWVLVNNENADNKKNSITASNKTSTDYYPSIKAVVDYLVANYENLSNKKTTLTGNESSNNYYPTTKAVADALNTKAPASTAYTFDTTTTNVVYNANNPKTIYLNATVAGEAGIVITAKDNDFQYFFGRDGSIKTRYWIGGTNYSGWYDKTEKPSNKADEITNANKTSTTLYPSIKAVVDYLVANYLGSGDNTVSWANLAAAVQTVINGKENLSNKKTTITGNETSEQYYPTTKAVADALSTKAPLSTAYTFDATTTNVVYDANNPKKIYLNATVAGEAGIVITAKDNDFQYFLGRRGTLKIRLRSGGTSYSDWTQVAEHVNNKMGSITNANKTSNVLYPTIKAVYDFGAQIVDDFNENITETNSNLSDLKTYIGYTDGDILGLHADFENKVFTRLGAAVGLSAGSDFNAFPMYGQRRRVVVESDGTITQNSPEQITSDICYDIMVYQPKFYYKVVPLKLEKQSSGLGYHIRKANYYISSTPHAGFKLHPLFYDKNGNEIEYVLFSAYEASYLYPTEGGFDYFHDGAGSDTGTSLDLEYGVLKSMPNVKPISGQYKAFNKTNAEILAQNKSSNWHLDTIQSVSANQLLMAIEYGSFNTQSAIGLGIVSIPGSNSINYSSLTGSTSEAMFNTNSGMASETIYDAAGTETPFNTNGKVAVSYRGMENPWGNIWKHVNGINIWGDGTMNGGQVFICDDFSFNESKHDGKYQSAGFTVSNGGGYVSAFGYGDEDYDWLFMPSETTGNSSLPVGDYFYSTSNLNEYRIVRFGGRWDNSDYAGGFLWHCTNVPDTRYYYVGGRLLYVPTATV